VKSEKENRKEKNNAESLKGRRAEAQSFNRRGWRLEEAWCNEEGPGGRLRLFSLPVRLGRRVMGDGAHL